jgi:arginyl-tRNA synthetase
VQYAHARMAAIFRRAGVDRPADVLESEPDLGLLTEPGELELIKLLLRFPEVVSSAAERYAPHSVCEYLEEVAGAVNSWYHSGNLNPELRVVGVAEPLSRARLVLVRAIQIVLSNGLALLGVGAPDRMEREAEPA